MNIIRAIACISVLAATSALGSTEEFKCPDGAKDSGYEPGNVVRWCEIEKGGRLLYHGPVWRWHRNGSLQSKENYIYGDADGDTPSWYENGKKSSHGKFKNGSKVGLWKYWDEQGRIRTEVTYAEGGHLRTGYYPSGSKKATGTFRSSGKLGKWAYWDAAGNEKARCDFGEGLFKVSSKPCQIIADELDPVGYSRPIPSGSVDSAGTCSLRIANQRYEFATPSGWIADAHAGTKDGAPLVFYRSGGGWKGAGPNLYIRPIFKDGASFEKVQEDYGQGFQESVAEYKETETTREKMSNGMATVKRTIRYKPLIQTDSPFSIVSDSTIYEVISFVNASDEIVLITVLTSPTEMDLKGFRQALSFLMRSVRMRSQ